MEPSAATSWMRRGAGGRGRTGRRAGRRGGSWGVAAGQDRWYGCMACVGAPSKRIGGRTSAVEVRQAPWPRREGYWSHQRFARRQLFRSSSRAPNRLPPSCISPCPTAQQAVSSAALITPCAHHCSTARFAGESSHPLQLSAAAHAPKLPLPAAALLGAGLLYTHPRRSQPAGLACRPCSHHRRRRPPPGRRCRPLRQVESRAAGAHSTMPQTWLVVQCYQCE